MTDLTTPLIDMQLTAVDVGIAILIDISRQRTLDVRQTGRLDADDLQVKVQPQAVSKTHPLPEQENYHEHNMMTQHNLNMMTQQVLSPYLVFFREQVVCVLVHRSNIGGKFSFLDGQSGIIWKTQTQPNINKQ